MLKSQKGITLVALVVTIIVLIILATISISIAVNSGLISNAETAAEWQTNADAELNDVLHDAETKVNDILYNVELKASETTSEEATE